MQEYLLYVPESATEHAPVFVSVHGISRNFLEQAGEFAPMCDRHGLVMLAPIFTADLHEDYQRLGRKGRGMRCDLLLHELLAETTALTSADVSQIHMFGFSAGAQFVHRYLMAHPHRVASAVIAAAGWYTFPDNRERFPYGIRPVSKLEGVTFDPEQFLHVPIEVIVGAEDTSRVNLRRTDRTNAQQGFDRIQRARRWVAAMQDTARQHGVESKVHLTEVPGIDHSFTTFCSHGRLAERVARGLFEPKPHPEALHLLVSEANGHNGNGRRVANGGGKH